MPGTARSARSAPSSRSRRSTSATERNGTYRRPDAAASAEATALGRANVTTVSAPRARTPATTPGSSSPTVKTTARISRNAAVGRESAMPGLRMRRRGRLGAPEQVRREAVRPLVREEPQAITGDESLEARRRLDRGARKLRPRRERAFDDALVFLLLEAASRVEKKSARGQKRRGRGERLLLEEGEALDGLRSHPVSDVRILSEGSGATARGVQEDPVESPPRQRQPREIRRDRADTRHGQPVRVLDDAPQARPRTIDCRRAACPCVGQGRE